MIGRRPRKRGAAVRRPPPPKRQRRPRGAGPRLTWPRLRWPRLASPRVYAARHLQVLVESLGRLARQPAASLMTAAVIGIALALPSGLLTLLDNLQRLSLSWEGTASISVFLHDEVAGDRARRLAEELRSWPEISTVNYISRDEALAEFRQHSGFGEVLDALETNPLPGVLVVEPTRQDLTPAGAEVLLERLQALEGTDLAQLDLQWVQRFAALMEIGRRGVLVAGALLALAVLLIVGNTIRLDIQNRREEIEVTKLIGGTDAFIRRPFLYTGFWYGVGGALLAWMLVQLAFLLLRGPVAHLAGLYDSSFPLQPLGLLDSLTLLLAGALLGWLGSGLAVSRHLRDIEPS